MRTSGDSGDSFESISMRTRAYSKLYFHFYKRNSHHTRCRNATRLDSTRDVHVLHLGAVVSVSFVSFNISWYIVEAFDGWMH
ncbi:hypothetical protein B0H12DRAFT_1097099 [Mycena haematopus]|nr:hypothetical protein B0H12DRAFT_1097099 [Mycena haematopus]